MAQNALQKGIHGGAACVCSGTVSYTHLLFDDSGYRGVVLFTTGMKNIGFDGEKIHAESGAMLTSLSSFAQKNSVAGFSFLYGIPGTVGGGLYMNCGAFGGEISDILTESTYSVSYTHLGVLYALLSCR